MRAFFASLNRLVATACVLFVLTGCAQLPKSGAIGIGPEIQFESDSSYLYYSPSSPSDGDSPQQIVSGFLSAGNGPQNDYSVARSFLTTGFQPDWRPSNEVLIQDGVPSFRFLGESQVTAEISVSAVIDSQGTYQSQAEGTKRFLNFKLEKQAGQWRISKAPGLTVLIRPNFAVLFKAYQLYFFDQNHTTLVPDVRWFPSRTSTATHLVQALLEGPKPWMSGALAWDFPEGTTLNLDSVTVADGEARVDLSSQAVAATNEQLRYMKAQIKATLLQIPSVTSVTISINNSPQIITDLRANIPNAIGASMVTLNEAGIFSSSGKALLSPNSASGALLAKATDFALNNAGDNLAVLSGGSIYQIRLNAIDKSPKIVDSRKNLLAPEFDSYGYLWSVGGSTNSAWRSVGKQDSHRVTSSSLLPAAVKAFSISPDGARIAVLYSGASPTIWVHTVKRDKAGQPLEIGAGIKVDTTLGEPISVQWADAIKLAVLTKFDAEGVRPAVITLGGETRSYSVVIGGAKMVANLSAPNILVTRRDGTLLSFKSNNWVQIATSVRAVHLSTVQ